MKTLAIINEKGGVGKSLLPLNLRFSAVSNSATGFLLWIWISKEIQAIF